MANKMMEMADAAESGEMGGNGGGYKICIMVDGSGKMSVGVESGGYEAAEESGAQSEGMEAPAMKPVGNVREAVQYVMDVVRSGGKTDTDDAETAAFKQGFGKKNRSPVVDRIREVEDNEMM